MAKLKVKGVKTIGLKQIAPWIIGVFTIIFGAAYVFSSLSYIWGALLIVLAGVMALPVFNDFLSKNLKINISIWLRVVIFILLWFFGLALVGAAMTRAA